MVQANDDLNTDPPVYPDHDMNLDAPIYPDDDSNLDPPVYPDDRPLTTTPLQGAEASPDPTLNASTSATSSDRSKKIHQDDRILDLEDQVRELREQNKALHQQFEQWRSNMAKPLAGSSPSSLASQSNGVTPDELSSAHTNDTAQTSAVTLYDKAQSHLLQENYAEAEQVLKQLIQQYPQDLLVINAYYWLGESHFIQKNYKQAALAFAEVYKHYGTLKQHQATTTSSSLTDPFVKVPEALIKLSRTLKAMGQTTQACIPLNQLELEFPQLPANIKKSLEMAKKDLPQRQKDNKGVS